MIEQSHQLSMCRECELLDINRSSYNFEPAIESEEKPRLMQLIDQQFLSTPFYGGRRMTACWQSGPTPNEAIHGRSKAMKDKQTVDGKS